MDVGADGPPVLDRGAYELEFSEDFAGPLLDRARWLDHNLPHWTTAARSARYGFDDDGLRLRIDADQPNWRDEDGTMRVSNLQTGSFAGPVGSMRGVGVRPGREPVKALSTRQLLLRAALN